MTALYNYQRSRETPKQQPYHFFNDEHLIIHRIVRLELTELGQSLSPVLDSLRHWGENYQAR